MKKSLKNGYLSHIFSIISKSFQVKMINEYTRVNRNVREIQGCHSEAIMRHLTQATGQKTKKIIKKKKLRVMNSRQNTVTKIEKNHKYIYIF